jgi:hypothetical protein
MVYGHNVFPSLSRDWRCRRPIASVVHDLLNARTRPPARMSRADSPQLTASPRGMADLLDTMTPRERD